MAWCEKSISDFVDYAAITFDTLEDNGKYVCYKASDNAQNATYKLSDQIEGIQIIKPVVSSVSVNNDPAKDGEIEVTVEFSQEMNVNIDPAVVIKGIAGGDIQVIKASYIKNTWIGKAIIPDNNANEIGENPYDHSLARNDSRN